MTLGSNGFSQLGVLGNLGVGDPVVTDRGLMVLGAGSLWH